MYRRVMDDRKKLFAQKLKELVIAKGHKAEAAVIMREFNLRYFGNGITLHAAAKWLRGESIPRQDKIMTLAKWLEVNPADLVFGTVDCSGERIQKNSWEQSLTYQEQVLFQKFLTLPVEQRKVVREVILAFDQIYSSDRKFES